MSWFDNGFEEAAPLIDLHRSRRRAHRAFDEIWMQKWGDKKHTRNLCYRWLAAQLGVAENRAHMAVMDEKTCARVVEICEGTKLSSVLEWKARLRIESRSHKEN